MTGSPTHAPGDPRPSSKFGPDFPIAYDDRIRHPAGLGRVQGERHGTEVAIIGAGISGLLAAHELMKMKLKPVVYQAGRHGGRLRSLPIGDTGPSAPIIATGLAPLRISSRATVDGWRPKVEAICASDCPTSRRRAIVHRSSNESCV